MLQEAPEQPLRIAEFCDACQRYYKPSGWSTLMINDPTSAQPALLTVQLRGEVRLCRSCAIAAHIQEARRNVVS